MKSSIGMFLTRDTDVFDLAGGKLALEFGDGVSGRYISTRSNKLHIIG